MTRLELWIFYVIFGGSALVGAALAIELETGLPARVVIEGWFR